MFPLREKSLHLLSFTDEEDLELEGGGADELSHNEFFLEYIVKYMQNLEAAVNIYLATVRPINEFLVSLGRRRFSTYSRNRASLKPSPELEHWDGKQYQVSKHIKEG